MERNLSGSRKIMMLIALYLSTICTMSDMVTVPIIAEFQEVFGGEAQVNLFLSLPGVIGLLFCYIGGRMADVFNKKTLLVGGYGMFTVASIFGATFLNFPYILTMRILTYIAWGFTSTAAVGIIAEFYVDVEKRGKIVGMYNSIMAIIGAVLSFVSGMLAMNGWKSAYYTYWISIPVLILLIIFVPNTGKDKKAQATETKSESRGKAPKGWFKHLIPLLGSFLVTGTCYYVVVYMISIYVTDTGIGQASLTGTLSSIGTITSCIACAAFGFVYAKFKEKTSLPSHLVMGLGFLLMFLFSSVGAAMFACGIMGAAWGIVFLLLHPVYRCSTG